ncbi:unnamed protein product [Gulo gulo]|uniref:Uncharacterized protein n=1 Tax=Gulo gulo TaxID=48420 RepID=A0A9X9LT86_GULGU|nr:unnamed protein product [Gulo gulo]
MYFISISQICYLFHLAHLLSHYASSLLIIFTL